MSSLGLGKRVLSPEEYQWSRDHQRGKEAAVFKLGERVTGIKPQPLPPTPKSPAVKIPATKPEEIPPLRLAGTRLPVPALEAALKKVNGATLTQLADDELDDSRAPSRIGALRALLAKGTKTPGVRSDLIARLNAALIEATAAPAAG
jgi:hypothetical protein